MKNFMKRAGWLLLTLLFVLTGLGFGVFAFWQATHQSNSSQANQNQQNIATVKGTKMKDFTPTSNIPKLEIIDKKVGTGKEVKADSKVTVLYTGAVAATGIIFDTTDDRQGQPITFPLNQVIKGWQEGMVGMKVGGMRRLLIPAELAYGAGPPPNSGIPAMADLVFDVTLIDVQ